ncbi:MAG TPA: hypothetical protein VKE73_04345, partial [Myxococcota bacterium]|nr:hypothetical protein [Myxococcota bacterium]
MQRLRFRAPGSALSLAELLARAAPSLAVPAIARALRAGAFRVRTSRGLALRDPGLRVEPGTAIDWSNPPPPSSVGPAEISQGPGSTALRCVALVPAPPWSAGRLGSPDPRDRAGLHFRRSELRDGVAELELELSAGNAETVRRSLAAAGFPVLGDAAFGGVLVEGGLRLRPVLPSQSASGLLSDGWWPGEPVFAPDLSSPEQAGAGACLEVSQATLRALSRGHPWVLTDSETGDAGRFRCGALVWLQSAEGAARGARRTLARV